MFCFTREIMHELKEKVEIAQLIVLILGQKT